MRVERASLRAVLDEIMALGKRMKEKVENSFILCVHEGAEEVRRYGRGG